jgi:hypothetical protein
MPAKAGIQAARSAVPDHFWIPAFAGMTATRTWTEII